MHIKEQVISLDQAARLKELGVNADSVFVWSCIMPDPTGEKYYYDLRYTESKPETLEEIIANAYTVAELGLMLPTGYDTMRITDIAHEVWRGYDDSGNDCAFINTGYNTEAQARASMLIYLLENNLITPEQVNQSIQ